MEKGIKAGEKTEKKRKLFGLSYFHIFGMNSQFLLGKYIALFLELGGW